jgi:hypothetical protein
VVSVRKSVVTKPVGRARESFVQSPELAGFRFRRGHPQRSEGPPKVILSEAKDLGVTPARGFPVVLRFASLSSG